MAVDRQKVAWVIGASSGIGKAISVRLASEGYKVVISARRAELLEKLAAQHSGLNPVVLDVGEHKACKLAASELLERHGQVDLFIYCAVNSGSHGGLHQSMSDALNVGLLGCTATLDQILKDMRTRKCGQVVLIGSPVGFRALPGTLNYGTTKAALEYLAQGLRLENAQYGIDVQLILPGFVDTPLTQRNQFPMPFLMTIEKAIDRIWDGLCHPNRFEIAFPRRLIWPMRLLAALPDPVYEKLMGFISNRMKR